MMEPTEFDQTQFGEAYPEHIERTWWQQGRMKVIARSFKKHVPFGEKILEIGCGTGILTNHLRSLGWDVRGVELGEPTEGLHSPEHLMLGTNALEVPTDIRESIDVLCLFDVIEHIENAPSFVKGLLKAYPNVNKVVVTVPARKELWTTFDDHFGHFRRYDRSMLESEFQEAGLRTISNKYFFHGLYPAIAVNNLIRGKKRNIVFKAPSPGIASTVHRALGTAFRWEANLLPGSIPGSSLLGIAVKP